MIYTLSSPYQVLSKGDDPVSCKAGPSPSAQDSSKQKRARHLQRLLIGFLFIHHKHTVHKPIIIQIKTRHHGATPLISLLHTHTTSLWVFQAGMEAAPPLWRPHQRFIATGKTFLTIGLHAVHQQRVRAQCPWANRVVGGASGKLHFHVRNTSCGASFRCVSIFCSLSCWQNPIQTFSH